MLHQLPIEVIHTILAYTGRPYSPVRPSWPNLPQQPISSCGQQQQQGSLNPIDTNFKLEYDYETLVSLAQTCKPLRHLLVSRPFVWSRLVVQVRNSSESQVNALDVPAFLRMHQKNRHSSSCIPSTFSTPQSKGLTFNRLNSQLGFRLNFIEQLCLRGMKGIDATSFIRILSHLPSLRLLDVSHTPDLWIPDILRSMEKYEYQVKIASHSLELQFVDFMYCGKSHPKWWILWNLKGNNSDWLKPMLHFLYEFLHCKKNVQASGNVLINPILCGVCDQAGIIDITKRTCFICHQTYPLIPAGCEECGKNELSKCACDCLDECDTYCCRDCLRTRGCQSCHRYCPEYGSQGHCMDLHHGYSTNVLYRCLDCNEFRSCGLCLLENDSGQLKCFTCNDVMCPVCAEGKFDCMCEDCHELFCKQCALKACGDCKMKLCRSCFLGPTCIEKEEEFTLCICCRNPSCK